MAPTWAVPGLLMFPVGDKSGFRVLWASLYAFSGLNLMNFWIFNKFGFLNLERVADLLF